MPPETQPHRRAVRYASAIGLSALLIGVVLSCGNLLPIFGRLNVSPSLSISAMVSALTNLGLVCSLFVTWYRRPGNVPQWFPLLPWPVLRVWRGVPPQQRQWFLVVGQVYLVVVPLAAFTLACCAWYTSSNLLVGCSLIITVLGLMQTAILSVPM